MASIIAMNTPHPARLEPHRVSSMKRVFISYRRDDSRDISKRIGGRLADHLGRRVVFIDVDAIPPAHDFRKVILRSIGEAGIVLVVYGPKWLMCVGKDGHRRLDSSDDNVRIEIENAMLRDIPILPVLVEGATMPA